ncbi:MAG: DUF2336 domain-containing protein, partial [Chloroflexota bacterium]
EELSYEDARAALETHSRTLKRDLAARTDVEPEILYYLATDDAADVRRIVAENPATPCHADHFLADDCDDEVRCALARKVARLMPDLDEAERVRTREMAIQTLEKLAGDQLPRVRAIVAEEIKNNPAVPRDIVLRLARDLEYIVSAPVIEYSPLLSDDDLIEIVATARASEVLVAVARRRELSAEVSEAVTATLDVPAVAALLTNKSAVIRAEALERIAEHAEAIYGWQKPLVLRPDLSVRAVRRIAGFVASSLLDILKRRNNLDDDTVSLINRRVHERLAHDVVGGEDEERQAAIRVVDDAVNAGGLDDAFVAAAAEAGSRDVVAEALARLARAPRANVDRLMAAHSAKALVALVYKSGLSMRVALKIQTFVLKLSNRDLLPARDGVHFPLGEDEMRWHLSYFGIEWERVR